MTLNIPRARAAATGAQVAAAMQGIIDSAVVMTTRGEPMAIHSADLVTTTRRDFDIR